MKINCNFLGILSTTLFFSCTSYKKELPEFTKVSPLKETWQPLPFSDVKPAGWLKEQMQHDLEGFIGHLDSLVPDLILQDDIYGKNRLTAKVKNKNVGAISDGGDWEVQFLWWNSETQGNWLDAYIRNAILTDNKNHIARAKKIIEKMMSTQDADGYLGIYDNDLRYKFTNENGELWSKVVLLRGMLAWYEYTKDENVLNSIIKASENVMMNYPVYQSNPFYSTQPNVSGLSHGLMITDVFEHLHRLTGNEKYLDYCLFLYNDFSVQTLNEDAQYKKLIIDTLGLEGHGVHTYEHLRAVAAAYYASGNQKLKTALDKFLIKISKTTTPSGAPIGDEWIRSRQANATNTGYEYCSILELMNSYTALMQKTAETDFGDKVEHMFFNAAQGARDNQHSCIAYLKTDNSFQMTGGQNFDTLETKQTRYKYSPAHQDAAVCCAPNAGRATPYYVQNMWMKDKDGLIATLLGPCEVSTQWSKQTVKIIESTSYPDNFDFQFTITTESPIMFALKIRKPDWATEVITTEKYKEANGFLVFEQEWNGVQKIEISFTPKVVKHSDQNGEVYFKYGPHVLAYPIQSTFTALKKFPLANFADYRYTATHPTVYQFVNSKLTAREEPDSLSFETTMHNTSTQQAEKITLVPMRQTILRQVSFQQKQ
jgi:uncharacterized protein